MVVEISMANENVAIVGLGWPFESVLEMRFRDE